MSGLHEFHQKNMIVLDAETLGTRSDAAIIEIAAYHVRIEVNTVKFVNYFGVYIHPDRQRAARSVDGETLRFWQLQAAEKKETAYRTAEMIGVSLPFALQTLTDFVRQVEETGFPTLWVRGQDFDIPILKTAFDAFRMEWPFAYNAGRDIRTLEQTALSFDSREMQKQYDHLYATHPPTDEKHDAGYDAHVGALTIAASYFTLAHRKNK